MEFMLIGFIIMAAIVFYYSLAAAAKRGEKLGERIEEETQEEK